MRLIIRDASRRMPEFAHIDWRRVLVVAGEARRASHASVRPLVSRRRSGGGKARVRTQVRIAGRQMLYCITLRPIFFRLETPERRVETVLHELFHISTRFDGTLHAGRRHKKLGPKFTQRLRPLVRRYLREMPEHLYESMAAHGLVNARQWLEKPGISAATSRSRRVYTEKQLFVGPMRMITRRKAPAASKGPGTPRAKGERVH